MLPNASGGKLTANANLTELGLKGYGVMSGLKKGAYDAVHAYILWCKGQSGSGRYRLGRGHTGFWDVP